MKLKLDLQISEVLQSTQYVLPSQEDFQLWAGNCILAHQKKTALNNNEFEICLRIADEEEARQINLQFRNKNQATNVLSFPADIPDALKHPLLGDLLICAPVVIQEAQQQNKTVQAHWAHLLVHGTLHLLGYDHIQDKDAQEMETLEIDILAGLHFNNPYTEQDYQDQPRLGNPEQ